VLPAGVVGGGEPVGVLLAWLAVASGPSVLDWLLASFCPELQPNWAIPIEHKATANLESAGGVTATRNANLGVTENTMFMPEFGLITTKHETWPDKFGQVGMLYTFGTRPPTYRICLPLDWVWS
jgi:hypothetical protein